MDTIAGMQRTGRRVPGPGGELVELVGDGDLKHTALVFASVYRDHPCLNGELEVGMGFMERPEVTGLSRLVGHDPDDGAFVYPTGTVWSVAEIVRELADQGDSGGVKAGLELCYLAGEILVEASDKASHSGLVGHGSLDPWKIVVKADGQIAILGYGLPRPEIEVLFEDESRPPGEDALRYCAPENLAVERLHDLSSDLFSLCLVALELMVGRPVYDGIASEIRKAASRGEAVRKLYAWRDRIPEPVREVLGKALKPDPDIRYRDGLDFVYSVHDLLAGIDAGDGPSLREIVTNVRARQKRGKAVVGGNTSALTKADLAELAADIDQQGVETDIPAPRRPRPEGEAESEDQPRWRRSTRGPRNEPAAPATPTPSGKPAEPATASPSTGGPRSRGAARVRTSDPAPERVASPRAAAADRPAEDPNNARERLLRRLRDRDESAPRRRRPGEEPGASSAMARPAPQVPAGTTGATPRAVEPGSTATPRDPVTPRDTSAPRARPAEQAPASPSSVGSAPVARSVASAPSPRPDASAPMPRADASPRAPEPSPPVPNPSVSDVPAPRPEAEPVTRSRPGGRAAALLERLRSTSGGRTMDEPPRPRTPRPVVPDEVVAAAAEPADPPVGEAVSAAPPAIDPAPPGPPAPPSGSASEGTTPDKGSGRSAPVARARAPQVAERAPQVAERAPQVAERPPQAAEPTPPSTTATPPVEPPDRSTPQVAELRPDAPAGRRPRARTSVPDEDATAAIDLTDRHAVKVGFLGRSISVRREGTAGRVCELAVDALELSVTDLMGARTASFRLLSDGRAVPSQTLAAELLGELTLARVQNQLVLATVEAPGDPGIRVKTPLGTAVPVGLLKRSLRELLALEGPFELTHEGRVLAADAVLADLGPSDATLSLRVTR